MNMGNSLDLLVETTDVEALTTAIRSEGIAVEMEIEQLPDVLPGPMLRLHLSRAELDRILAAEPRCGSHRNFYTR